MFILVAVVQTRGRWFIIDENTGQKLVDRAFRTRAKAREVALRFEQTRQFF